MMSNIDILKKSVQDLKVYWSMALLASIPLSLLPSFFVLERTVGLLIFLIFSGAFRAGLSKVTLLITTQQPVKLFNVLDGFYSFKNSLGVFLISMVFIALGILCFIIPGIIIAIWLSQSFFILVENPNMEPLEILKKSKEIMRGNELNYLLLFLIFIALSVILLLFNLVLLSLLIVPIQYIVFANFYNHIKS